MALVLFGALLYRPAPVRAQDPVLRPDVDIEQDKLLQNCPLATSQYCYYPLKKVLESGGDFFSTPFLPYNPALTTPEKGDGYGEGRMGPRAAQRAAFREAFPAQPAPATNGGDYPLLRMNGLDSQSCYECHNSIGSSHQTYGKALMRKPFRSAAAPAQTAMRLSIRFSRS